MQIPDDVNVAEEMKKMETDLKATSPAAKEINEQMTHMK